MPHTTQTSDFWGWYLRHNSRTIWKYLSDAGIDLFASGPSNNPEAFLDLTNILPAINGGFNKRWGISSYITSAVYPSTGFNGIVRTLLYNYPQDASNPSTTANTNLWIVTDNQNFLSFSDAGTVYSGYGPTNFAHVGEVSSANSRGYLYYANGVDPIRKVNPSVTGSNTDSLVGIALTATPLGGDVIVGVTPDNIGSYAPNCNLYSTGLGYITPPAVTVTDALGSGTGATVTVTSLGTRGEITGVSFTPGSGYVQAQATIAAPPSGGTQGCIVLYTQSNSGAPKYGEVVGFDLAGQINLISGRQYGVALQNSKTGHTSDVNVSSQALNGQPPVIFPAGHPNLDKLVENFSTITAATVSNIPVYSISTNFTAGVTQIEFTILVPANGLDPQVDTVVLMACADGQGLSTLYQVATIPLSSFTYDSTMLCYRYLYLDTLPDSYNDQTTTGSTLLAADIWAETDSDGTTTGIFLNTPPVPQMKYLTQHQGRMFGTDGKTIFFSKSLDEVTTSTGLITSKWEECWPGDYQLAVALNNEEINSLRSDGTNLHAGTEKSIFTVYGSDPSSFSVPSVAFAETGVLNNDCWSVVYAEGQPSGFVWITPDYKVMHSDFSTYREIGTPIYPVLQTIDPTKLENCKVMSLTQGAYNFVVLCLYLTTATGFQPEFYIYETRLGKWYHWTLPSSFSGHSFGMTLSVPTAFVYQFPQYTNSTTITPGNRYIMFWNPDAAIYPSTGSIELFYFNPAQTIDQGGYDIPWRVQTSWQDLQDSTSIKCINEIEVTSDDVPLNVTLLGATSQAQFDAGGVVLKTGQTVAAPISALGVNKFYTAGSPTSAKYYSIVFSPVTSSASASALTSFSLESYPMARI